jgi:hypothetical protein
MSQIVITPSTTDGVDSDVLSQRQSDFSARYKKHGPAIERYWQSAHPGELSFVMRIPYLASILYGREYRGEDLRLMEEIVPELVWKECAQHPCRPEFFLEMMKHRATASLEEQCSSGVNHGRGDIAIAKDCDTIQNGGWHRWQQRPGQKENWTLLYGVPGKWKYGTHIQGDHPSVHDSSADPMMGTHTVPQLVGEVVLLRQESMFESLFLVMEAILALASDSRSSDKRPTKADLGAPLASAFSTLRVKPQPVEVSLEDILAMAQDQRETMGGYLNLQTTQPTVLVHVVFNNFHTQPAMVPDEKGRALPVFTDRYISLAVFDVVHGATKAAALWTYIHQLLERLKATEDRSYRLIILQEISNVCHLEYDRAQAALKRQVQMGSGAKCFRRVNNCHDKAGNPRVNIKGELNLKLLSNSNPQLHHLLQLCKTETTAVKALTWVQHLSGFHETQPAQQDDGTEVEDALYDMVMIVSLIKDLSSTLSMPPRRKKARISVKIQALDEELTRLKDQVDLRDFVVPISNLLEPGVTKCALEALQRFVVNMTGTEFGFLYEDLIQDALANLDAQYDYEQNKPKPVSYQASTTPASPTPETRAQLVDKRKEKEKTRPSHSSIFITVPMEDHTMANRMNASVPSEVYKVKRSTADVFFTLFAKAEARGTVTWSAFEGAMADLGFSVTPGRVGSAYAFSPPDTMAVKQSFTHHRPHSGKIEGWRILGLASRLKDKYGWSERSFVVE